ncbi:MAG: glycoside hydrolase family 9 protein, partial [Rikenellaceae bacterium]|nr:glycoside hydrolase family 9 protein [Rikenellaceae bacterium]
MKKLTILAVALLAAASVSAKSWIRTNLIGYVNTLPKVAVVIADTPTEVATFDVCEARSGKVVFTGKAIEKDASIWGMKSAYRLPFTELSKEGSYYIKIGDTRSENFRIGNDIYADAGNMPLFYMRQQRCGYNPYTGEDCHQYDGFIVDHPTRTGEHIDVRGGWHDATDQLQYLMTSANATFQMLFAYYKNPDQFTDKFNAAGDKGKNGVPDILDEARWGLEWMKRMNPDSAVMFNQIADDRDHTGIREPHTDMVDYGYGPGKGRPVYFITGEIQGLGKYKNRNTGVASAAAKYASAFALGSVLFEKFDPEFAQSMKKKAVDAMAFAEAKPGAFHGVCYKEPYFYEEANWIDDMELAAAALHLMEPENEYWLKRADYWGELEPITPWMETGKARHYQWYPFVNVGHYLIAEAGNDAQKAKYESYMGEGLMHIENR